MRRRKNQGHRAFVASFSIVLGVLVVGAISIAYFSGQPMVNHLPANIPSYTASWADYVPASYLQMGLQNFTFTRSINSSVPPEGRVLQLIAPDFNITTSEVKMLLTVTLTSPNQTVDIAFITHTAYDSLNASLAGRERFSNMTAGGRIYFVGARANSTTVEFGWLAPVARDSAVVYGVGYQSAQVAVEEVLGTAAGTSPSMLTLQSVQRALYVMGGPYGHLALGFVNFQGVVRTSNLTATAIDYTGGSVSISDVVGFNSAQTSFSQYGYVKSVYKQYHQFTIYDEFVKVYGTVPAAQLEAMVRMVE